MKPGPKTKPVRDRFEKFIIPEPNSGCWLWAGGIMGSGYGTMGLNNPRRQEGAHRVSYSIYCGEIPDDNHVLHKCDNKLCVNPAHLFVGTRLDNMADMKKKGRHVGNRRLTINHVRQIRTRAKAGENSSIIAKDIGTTIANVRRIASLVRWKDRF